MILGKLCQMLPPTTTTGPIKAKIISLKTNKHPFYKLFLYLYFSEKETFRQTQNVPNVAKFVPQMSASRGCDAAGEYSDLDDSDDDSDGDNDDDCVKVRTNGSRLLPHQLSGGAPSLQVRMTMIVIMRMIMMMMLMIFRYGVLEHIFLPPTAVSIPRTQVSSVQNSIVFIN